MYIDFFLVLAMSHMKCKQHKASHNILIAGPGPMRVCCMLQNPVVTRQSKAYR